MYVEGGGEEVGVGEVVKLASFPHSVLYSTLGEKFSVLPPQGQRRTNAVSPADGRFGSQEIRVLFLPPLTPFASSDARSYTKQEKEEKASTTTKRKKKLKKESVRGRETKFRSGTLFLQRP